MKNFIFILLLLHGNQAYAYTPPSSQEYIVVLFDELLINNPREITREYVLNISKDIIKRIDGIIILDILHGNINAFVIKTIKENIHVISQDKRVEFIQENSIYLVD